jgi:hypothetical protein
VSTGSATASIASPRSRRRDIEDGSAGIYDVIVSLRSASQPPQPSSGLLSPMRT